MKKLNFDVLIIGSGIAGLYCALNLRDDLSIALVTKKTLTDSNSYLAQGGIATARDNEDIPYHIEDTLRAGQYHNNVEAVKTLVEESRENIDKLLELDVAFDTVEGELVYTKEAAHSNHRIVHFKDETGKSVVDGLCKVLKKKTNITVFEDTTLVDLLVKDNTCYGGILVSSDGNTLTLNSKKVVLATGGIGGLFKNSTNQRHVKGDGIYLALKYNIALKDCEYIQVHPTALHENSEDNRRFLISESLRGEGGKLLNINSESFVDELLPRDKVSQEILKEMKRTNSEFVYLNMTNLDAQYLIHRFPAIYKKCLSIGIDITKDYIPVSPAQHYFMGGIEVNLYSESSMNNLFALGEVSCTGVHGANRLASNSLLEGLVFSRRAAQKINDEIDITPLVVLDDIYNAASLKEYNQQQIETLKNFFKEKVGFLSDELVNNR
ncbi:MAG: L-aspartate oxidase [Clostridiaceae bacterium]